MPPSRPSADGGLVAAWRSRGAVACLLFPVSLAFRALVALRRVAYRKGWLQQARLPVPVVIVGNITVGGSGKTPLVIYLVEGLRRAGRHPGVLARGYLGSEAGPAEVPADGSPAIYGDEAVLLARAGKVPVFVGRQRAAAGRALLAAYPRCDVLICDDGLQHYGLAREVEIAVFDSRGIGNGWCLPAGPLREPVGRIADTDAMVLNEFAVPPAPTFGRPVFNMSLVPGRFAALDDRSRTCATIDLAGQTLHAVAGIGAPERFFDVLRRMELDFEAHPFPDHHAYRPEDLEFVGGSILTTEKDAVKLARLGLTMPVWVLPVEASVSPDLARFVLEKLNGCTLA